ncbi:hypothetical protein COU37_01570 [Candidatus Micrarchaeota archaeon CG10_big_fil_rev_8_21_14_0_10_45_29]|nr:MAG: hypothetical protein COU37_01570 [Candidatus Micrarchaeota archaeon CG10_big_fil_rev_8_21_14_0_10_45_29]
MVQKKFLFITVLLAMLAIPFAATDVELKAQAINYTLKQAIELEEAPLLDNFFSNDSQEYVIAYIDRNPAFLLNLLKVDGNYTAIIVDDNQRIAEVIQRRYDQQIAAGNEEVPLREQLHEYVLIFNSSRYFGEEKYNMLLGLGNSTCTGIEECGFFCIKSSVCNFAHQMDGDELLYAMITYSTGKENIEKIMEAENALYAASAEKTDIQIIDAYGEILQQLNNEISQMKNSSILKGTSSIYSGEIGYDEGALVDANSRIVIALTPAQMAQSKDEMIAQIQQITALHAPKIQEPEEEEVQNVTEEIFPIINESVAAQEEENVTAPLAPVKEASANGADEFMQNAAFVLVALLIIAAGITLLKIGRKGGKKGLEHHKARHKKQVYSLEDLV